jgi:hypothetical protein
MCSDSKINNKQIINIQIGLHWLRTVKIDWVKVLNQLTPLHTQNSEDF